MTQTTKFCVSFTLSYIVGCWELLLLQSHQLLDFYSFVCVLALCRTSAHIEHL